VSHTRSHLSPAAASAQDFGPLSVEERDLLAKLDLTRLPRHVAVIMDGNGRWAQRRMLPRFAGHRAGTKTARTTIETCARLKIEALTLYAFSVENWRRPKAETDFLMQLLREYLRKEMPLLQKNNIRMRFLGRIDELPHGVQSDVRETTELTASNTGMSLCIALNYGGRAEIVDAVNSILASRNAAANSNGSGNLGEQGTVPQRNHPPTAENVSRITEDQLSNHLYTGGLPEPDLLIRTSGEMRVSNFLLWQIAYAEIFVTETLWPDFNRARLLEALVDFQKRERRYGGIQQDSISQLSAPSADVQHEEDPHQHATQPSHSDELSHDENQHQPAFHHAPRLARK
jgi:undecaprenyl diphosphate synthase